MTTLTTTNINEAVSALRRGDCIDLNVSNAGWGDAELFELIKCIAVGLGKNLISLNLSGNNFTREGLVVLCNIIGPANVARATANVYQATVKTNTNPQSK